MPYQIDQANLFQVKDVEGLIVSNQDSLCKIADIRQTIFSAIELYGELSNSEILKSAGGPANAIPDSWLSQRSIQFTCDSLNIYCLKNPKVFGGLIVKRSFSKNLHEAGQLILTSKMELIRPSYGLMDGSGSLPSDVLEHDESGKSFLKTEHLPEMTVQKGIFYLIGNVHVHFGHVILEGLSRLWGLSLIPEALKHEMKYIVYEPFLLPFVKDLLRMCGVPIDRVVSAPVFGEFECVFTADAASKTHSWISEKQFIVWQMIRRHALDQVSDALTTARRIYLSRRKIDNRSLLNEDEIENIHIKFGYQIVFPETLTVVEQICLVANATHLSGCVGSQLYLAAFQPNGGRNIVLAPRNFLLRDDFLIASGKEHLLKVVVGSVYNFNDRSGWYIDANLVTIALASF